MNSIKYLFLIFAFALAACQKEDVLEKNEAVIYSSSFEMESDTIGWRGNCWIDLVNEAPEGGGHQSLSVSCGCIIPHAQLKLGASDEDKNLIISCWAKGYGLGRSVGLSTLGEDFFSVGFSVPDTTWQYYQSVDTLFCPAGEQPVIHLSAGGIASGTVYVDLLEVREVD